MNFHITILSLIFQNDIYCSLRNSIKVIKMASKSSKWHQSHQSHQNGIRVIKVIRASFFPGHLGISPNFHPSLHSWIETIWDLGPSDQSLENDYPKILHNLVKSCLIWMVFTFLEMGADSGSNRPIKVINSAHFNLALSR